jgi:hypothetical protein
VRVLFLHSLVVLGTSADGPHTRAVEAWLGLRSDFISYKRSGIGQGWLVDYFSCRPKKEKEEEGEKKKNKSNMS